MKSVKTCPKCNGAGEYEEFPHYNLDEPHTWVICENCGGEGKVSIGDNK